MDSISFQFRLKINTDIGRRLFGHAEQMENLSDKDVERVMQLQRRLQSPQQKNQDLPLHWYCIDSVSFCCWIDQQWSSHYFDRQHCSEIELLQQFYQLLAQYPQATRVGWQTQSLLPLLRQRQLLLSQVALPVTDEKIIDLAEHLQLSNEPQALAELAQLLGFPMANNEASPQQVAQLSVLQLHGLFLQHCFVSQKLNQTSFSQATKDLHQQMKSICMTL